MSGTCAGTPKSVCVVSGSGDVRHVCWYTSVCLCCFKELRRQTRVSDVSTLLKPSLFLPEKKTP